MQTLQSELQRSQRNLKQFLEASETKAFECLLMDPKHRRKWCKIHHFHAYFLIKKWWWNGHSLWCIGESSNMIFRDCIHENDCFLTLEKLYEKCASSHSQNEIDEYYIKIPKFFRWKDGKMEIPRNESGIRGQLLTNAQYFYTRLSTFWPTRRRHCPRTTIWALSRTMSFFFICLNNNRETSKPINPHLYLHPLLEESSHCIGDPKWIDCRRAHEWVFWTSQHMNSDRPLMSSIDHVTNDRCLSAIKK